MFLTILSGHVKNENRRSLEESFAKKAKHPPEGLLQSFLIHDKEDKSGWQIITIWRNEESYMTAKTAKKTDTYEALLCDEGSTPERRHFDVAERFIRIGSE